MEGGGVGQGGLGAVDERRLEIQVVDLVGCGWDRHIGDRWGYLELLEFI